MIIRLAAADDIQAIGVLAEESELFPSTMAADLIAPFLGTDETQDLWLVAVDGDQLGFAYTAAEKLTVGTFNMLALGTARAARGRGIGGALVAETERLLAGRSARILMAETSSTPAFASTRRFYANRGFREVARIPGFWDVGDDKLVYLKSLSDGEATEQTVKIA